MGLKQPHKVTSLYMYASLLCDKSDFLQDDTNYNFRINPPFNTKSDFQPSPLPPFGENCTILSSKKKKVIAGLKPIGLKMTNFYLLLKLPIQIMPQLLKCRPV